MSKENKPFRFKQFSLDQTNCAMKVGTDGVLLGAWADVSKAQKVLDVGCGTGLISLMLAQRFVGCRITAIEIDAEAARTAHNNAQNSPWGDRIDITAADFLAWDSGEKFDHIVSNPPFYQNNHFCPDKKRSTARHSFGLPLDTLLKKSGSLLNTNGKISLVLPIDSYADICEFGRVNGFFPSRLLHVKGTPSKPAKRILIEFSREKPQQCPGLTLVLEDEPNRRSDDYRRLTEDFYL